MRDLIKNKTGIISTEKNFKRGPKNRGIPRFMAWFMGLMTILPLIAAPSFALADDAPPLTPSQAAAWEAAAAQGKAALAAHHASPVTGPATDASPAGSEGTSQDEPYLDCRSHGGIWGHWLASGRFYPSSASFQDCPDCSCEHF